MFSHLLECIPAESDCMKVERAFSAYKNGGYVAPPLFNHENCWKPLRDFSGNLGKVKEERWASILRTAQCHFESNHNSDSDDGVAARADESMISAFRAGVYIPESSPFKA